VIDKNLENQIRALKTTAKQIRHKTPQQIRQEEVKDRQEARHKVQSFAQKPRKIILPKQPGDGVVKSIGLLQAYGEFDRFMNMSKKYLHDKKQQLNQEKHVSSQEDRALKLYNEIS